MKRFDSASSNSITLMTLLTTLTFYFHKVISALMTQFTIPTPALSLLKTSLKNSHQKVCTFYFLCEATVILHATIFTQQPLKSRS